VAERLHSVAEIATALLGGRVNLKNPFFTKNLQSHSQTTRSRTLINEATDCRQQDAQRLKNEGALGPTVFSLFGRWHELKRIPAEFLRADSKLAAASPIAATRCSSTW
jgi:hypothetical protein